MFWHQDLSYFELHYALFDQITSGNVDKQRWIQRRRIGLTLKAFHLFYIQIVYPLNMESQVTHFDWITLGSFPSAFHVYLACFLLSTGFLYKQTYQNPNNVKIFSLVRQVLHKSSNLLEEAQRVRIVRITLYLLNSYQSIYWFNHAYLLMIQIQCYNRYYRRFQGNFWNLLTIGLIQHFNALVTLLVMHHMIQICIFVGINYNVVTMSLFSRLTLLSNRIKLACFRQKIVMRSKWSRVVQTNQLSHWCAQISQTHQRCLIDALNVNQYFGPIILGFVLLNSPANAYQIGRAHV